MQTRTSKTIFLLSIVSTAGAAQAAMTLLPTSSCSHTGNLVTNGSFETGSPGPGGANHRFWATGTTHTPFAVPPGWSSSGASNTYAVWGSDGLPRLRFSDFFPDGQIGMYFGNGAGATVNQAPNFQANGQVTFSSPPTITTVFASAPAQLWQSVPTDVNLASSYCFNFWVSGESASGGASGPPDGIFGLRVTNVLPGDPIQYFTVPGGAGLLGKSHRFHFDLVPLNPLVPIQIEFINWGHFDLSAHGMPPFTTELVLDDVIVNMTPEPGSLLLLAGGGLFVLKRRRVA